MSQGGLIEEIPLDWSDADSYDDDENGFHWLDYVIFILTLVIALGVGVYHGCVGQQTTKDYLMGNRQLKPFPVALSIFMSVISGILVLGTSAEMYVYGTQLWMDSVARAIFYAISAHLFVPMMFKLKVTSVFEYHRLRYQSRVLHMTCVILEIISVLMYMGLAMYAPSTALEAVTGFPVWASIVCTGIVAVIYTTIGGIKAVVWTDFFQGFIMFGGLIIVLVVGCIKVGGISEVWEISKQNGRIIFFNMDPDPTERATFWSVFIGSGIIALAQSASEQTQVQRYCALPNIKDATLAVLLQIPLIISVFTLVCLCGLTAFAYYETVGCDPLRSGQISNSNQILPYFLVNAVGYPGLTGLFIAVLYSGALSSVSSSMSALAAITWKDVFEQRFHGIDEFRKTLITKAASCIYGTIGVCIGFLMQNLKGHVMQLSSAVIGGVYGPLSAVIVTGSLFPFVQWKGMVVGVYSGIFMTSWINIGQYIYYPHRSQLNTTVENCSFEGNETADEILDDRTDVFWLYRLSYLYIGFIGFFVAMVVAIITSLITGKQDPKTVNVKTLVNVSNRCFCYCSPSCKDKCHCGVDFYQEDEDDMEEKEKEPNIIDKSEKTEGCYNMSMEYGEVMDNKINEKPPVKKETGQSEEDQYSTYL